MAFSAKRILCVDDDDDTCTMLEVFLTQAGYSVTAVRSADEGLKYAQTETFDLYLLDLWIKSGEGLELCQKIREQDEKTPVIIYSADARQETQNKIADMCVQAFLVKPKGLDELIATIERLIV